MSSLNKQTNFEGGISTGTPGQDAMPNLTPIGVRLSPGRLTKTIQIPANTAVVSFSVMPTSTSTPTAGTVDIGITGTLQKYAAAAACNALAYQTAAATPGVIAAAEDVIFTASGALDGEVLVMLNVAPLTKYA